MQKFGKVPNMRFPPIRVFFDMPTLSTNSTGMDMDSACGNSKIHWTIDMMMMTEPWLVLLL